MIHATIYTAANGEPAGAFLEVRNCLDDSGKPVIYARRFLNVAEMQRYANYLKDLHSCSICIKNEIEPD